MMNEKLYPLVADYVRAVDAKTEAERNLKRASEAIEEAAANISRFAHSLKMEASDTPRYIDVGNNRLVVVSHSILEICPLWRASNK